MDWKRFSFIGFIIILLFGAVVLVGSVQQRPLLIVTSMLATTIAVAGLPLGARIEIELVAAASPPR